MTIKWSVSKAIDSLQNLTNPFEQAGIQNTNQKPKLSEVITSMANNKNGEQEQQPL